MSELKTLKDIEKITGLDETCRRLFETSLKAEAIKWVKSPEKSYYTTINWILHFFNITEEDLKGGNE